MWHSNRLDSMRTGVGVATLRVLIGRDPAGLDCGTCAADTGGSCLPSNHDGHGRTQRWRRPSRFRQKTREGRRLTSSTLDRKAEHAQQRM